MNRLEDLVPKKTWNVMRGIAYGFPREMKYYCRIHKTEETANLIGVMEDDEGVFALYNTPKGHTLNHETIVQIANGVWSEEEWKLYGEIKNESEPKPEYKPSTPVSGWQASHSESQYPNTGAKGWGSQ